MSATVILPLWLVVLALVLAAIAALDRILAPSVRWFFRRRMERVVAQLNTRLARPIEPFKLMQRQDMIVRLSYDPLVMQAVVEHACEAGVPESVAFQQARAYAREIVPSFSATVYFGVAIQLARWLSRLLYRVRLGHFDEAALGAIDPRATVVFVMNHRSNMDYVLVTYLASDRSALSYAVGEWARIWGLEGLIRSMGAYFIRRNSGDPLYRRVLARYVAMATRQGVTQAVFPEGGLSRDGRLGVPKLGILSYIVSDFDAVADRDIVFIPVGINYDRVLEDRILTAKAEKEITGRNFRPGLLGVFKFLAHMIQLRLTGRLYRFGYACVSFGKPLSLRQWQKQRGVDFRHLPPEERFEAVAALGDELVKAIGAVLPALPVAMAATVFLQAGAKSISEFEVKSGIADLIEKLEKRSVHVHIPRADHDYASGAGLRMLTLRHIVEQSEDGLYRANPKEMILLRYYANSIAHHLPG